MQIDEDLDLSGLDFGDDDAPVRQECEICRGKKPDWHVSLLDGELEKGLYQGIYKCRCGTTTEALADPEFRKRAALHGEILPIMRKLRELDKQTLAAQSHCFKLLESIQAEREKLNLALMRVNRIRRPSSEWTKDER